MRPSLALQIYRDRNREIALSHRVKNVRMFGSALHSDDSGLGIPVNVMTPRALPDKWRGNVIA